MKEGTLIDINDMNKYKAMRGNTNTGSQGESSCLHYLEWLFR